MSGAGGDGLQLQARTARGSGRGGGYVCTAAHRFYVPALQVAGYEQGTGATQSRDTKTIGGVRPGYGDRG